MLHVNISVKRKKLKKIKGTFIYFEETKLF